jgi:hypothetical protein
MEGAAPNELLAGVMRDLRCLVTPWLADHRNDSSHMKDFKQFGTSASIASALAILAVCGFV